METTTTIELQEKVRTLESTLAGEQQRFAEQRALLKDLFESKAGELSQALQNMENLQRELSDVRSAAELSESGKLDEYSSLRVQYETQINSLQAILNESMEESHKLNAEKQMWQEERKQLLHQMHQRKSHMHPSGGDLNSGVGAGHTLEVQMTSSSSPSSPHRVIRAKSPEEKQQQPLLENQIQLEQQMERAKADADALRTVIVPYEEEIKHLKSQLNKFACDHTLEKEHLHKEQERNAVLQRMWQLATLQHLDWRERNVRLLLQVLNFLSEEQVQQLRASLHSQKLRSARLLSVSGNAAAASHAVNNVEDTVQRKHLQRLLDLRSITRNKSSTSLDCKLLKSSTGNQEKSEECEVNLTRHASFLHRSLSDDLLHSTHAPFHLEKSHGEPENPNLANFTEEDFVALFEMAAAAPSRSADSTVQKTEDVVAAAKKEFHSSAAAAVPVGQRLVSEREYTRLHLELESVRKRLNMALAREESALSSGASTTHASLSSTSQEKGRCAMCRNYEDQLQSLQETYLEVEKKKNILQHNLAEERQVNCSLREIQGDLENRLKTKCSAQAEKIHFLEERMLTAETNLRQQQTKWAESSQLVREEFLAIQSQHTRLHEKALIIKKKYDSLMGRREAVKAHQLLNEDIQLPSSGEELQLYALQLREKLIDTLASKEHLEESLKSENLLLRDQNRSLSDQWKACSSQLERAKHQLQECEALRESCSIELDKHRQLCHDKHEKADDMMKELWELKRKCNSLQIELENSESVQRDFVQLSQRLQMQLEQLRQQESSDVRWQHEEDVPACNECSTSFHALSRASAFSVKTKQHCRHCGKIFCSDCLNKTVYSGPNKRPSLVCSVCHTMLVKDAVPYFSIQAHNSQHQPVRSSLAGDRDGAFNQFNNNSTNNT